MGTCIGSDPAETRTFVSSRCMASKTADSLGHDLIGPRCWRCSLLWRLEDGSFLALEAFWCSRDLALDPKNAAKGPARGEVGGRLETNGS